MRRVLALAVACAALAIGVATAHSQDGKAGQLVVTQGGKERFPVPQTWTISTTRASAMNAIAAWSAVVPDEKGPVVVEIGALEGVRDERLWAARVAAGDATARFVATPIPHVLHEAKSRDGAPVFQCRVARVVKRRGYVITLEGSKAFVEKTAPVFVAGAAKLELTRPEVPELPEAYRRVLRDGYEYCLPASVKDADVAPVHKFVLAQEAAYAKRYGPVVKPPNNPIVVVMHATADEAAKAVLSGISSYHGMNADPSAGAMLALTTSKDAGAAQNDFAGCCALVFHAQVFGAPVASWHAMGDARLATLETTGGRPLPEIAESLASKAPSSLRPLRDLVANEKGSAADDGEAAVYLAFLRTGTKPYSDAFAAYVKAVRDGADPKAACEKTLLALDQEKLRAAAEAFMKSFKPIKGK